MSHTNIYNPDIFSKIDDENKLSCFFQKNEKVCNFAFKIFYKALKHADESDFTKKELINNLLESTMKDNPNLIDKPGFNKTEADNIYTIIIQEKHNEDEACSILFGNNIQSKIHQIMGTVFSLARDKKYLIYTIEKNNTLRNNFMRGFRKLFRLPNTDYSFPKILEILKSVNPNNSFILLDLIGHQNCPISLFRRQMSQAPYLRSRRIPNVIKSKPASSYRDCHINVANNDIDKEIVLATSYYDTGNTIFSKLFEKYKRNIVAGPSGTAPIFYIVIFHSLDIKTTLENKILLLCCIVADFVPFFHSLPEILVTYMYELPDLSFKYDLSMEPVEYTKKITKKYLNLNKSMKTISPTLSPTLSRRRLSRTTVRQSSRKKSSRKPPSPHQMTRRSQVKSSS